MLGSISLNSTSLDVVQIMPYGGLRRYARLSARDRSIGRRIALPAVARRHRAVPYRMFPPRQDFFAHAYVAGPEESFESHINVRHEDRRRRK